jgi:hypothetical protein
MQNIEANNYLDAYGRLLAGEIDAMEDARHLLVMLDQCEDVVLKIRRGALSSGTSVALTYLLVALVQSIDRLRKLLFLVDVSGTAEARRRSTCRRSPTTRPAGAPPTSLRRAGPDLAQELTEAHNTKYEVRGLLRDNIDLLARNVTENASRTGEHYIAERRRAAQHVRLRGRRRLHRRLHGAGQDPAVLPAPRAADRSPPVQHELLARLHAGARAALHHRHQAAGDDGRAHRRRPARRHPGRLAYRQVDVDSMAALVNKVFRTQIVAVLGNLATDDPDRLPARARLVPDRAPPGERVQGART